MLLKLLKQPTVVFVVLESNNDSNLVKYCRGNFAGLLHELLETRKNTFDYIIVETTGMADPGFMSVFYEEPFKNQLFLDGVITVVDGGNVWKRLPMSDEVPVEAKKTENEQIQIVNEALEQIAAADVVLLNKTDLINAEFQSEISNRISKINPLASIIKTERSIVDVQR